MQSGVSGARRNTRIGVMWLEGPGFPTTWTSVLSDVFKAIRQKGTKSEIGRQMNHGIFSFLPQDVLGSPMSVYRFIKKVSSLVLNLDHALTPQQFLPHSASSRAAGPKRGLSSWAPPYTQDAQTCHQQISCLGP